MRILTAVWALALSQLQSRSLDSFTLVDKCKSVSLHWRMGFLHNSSVVWGFGVLPTSIFGVFNSCSQVGSGWTATIGTLPTVEVQSFR